MKIATLLIITVLTLHSVLAISTDLKMSYSPGETIITEISGNILEPLLTSNVNLYRDYIEQPLEFDIKKLDNRYFIWMTAPKFENTYTLVIKDIVTTTSGKVEKIDFMQNFSVSGSLVDYSIKPGLIFTSKDFEITAILNEDKEKEISLDFSNRGNFTLHPGSNTIKLSISEIKETSFTRINIGRYSVPAFIIKDSEPYVKTLPSIRFFPRIISSITTSEQNNSYPLSLINEGGDDLENISLQYNKDLFKISPEILSIKANETVSSNLTLQRTSANITEKVIASSGEYEVILSVEINFTDKLSEIKTPYLEKGYEETQGYTCRQLNGTFCGPSEICEAKTITSRDDPNCCVIGCSLEEKSSGLSWISYLLLAILLIIIIFVFIKYKKSKRMKTPLEQKISKKI